MARRRRKHIPIKTKLAAALLALGHIDYEESKRMTPDQIIRHYDWDHWPVLHALGGRDVPWNLRPLLRAAHRSKSGKDTTAVAKVKRIQRKMVGTARVSTYLVTPGRHATGKAAGSFLRPPGKKLRSYRKLRSRGFQGAKSRPPGKRFFKATPPRDIRTDGFT